MKLIISILVFILGIFTATSQISSIAEEFALPASLSESSGIIYFNDKLITHNDSGGNNELYEVDLVTGLVTRTITISNATNTDWEDLAQDETHIYIGDIGNNFSGNRTDLKIYKISKSDYLNADNVTAETILFNFSDQTDFTALSPNTTEWDAEALISFDADNLILFTKNWINGITKGYLIPKSPGSYGVSPLQTTLNAGGLISGATYNTLSGKLFLVGYTAPVLPSPLQPFVWKCENFSGNDILSGSNTLTNLSTTFGFEQTEAITYRDESSYYVTSEAFSVSIISDYAKLISFSSSDMALSTTTIQKENDVVLHPNPVSDVLQINTERLNSVEIFDTKLTQLYRGFSNNIDMSSFSNGIYIVRVNLNNNTYIIKKVVKK